MKYVGVFHVANGFVLMDAKGNRKPWDILGINLKHEGLEPLKRPQTTSNLLKHVVVSFLGCKGITFSCKKHVLLLHFRKPRD